MKKTTVVTTLALLVLGCSEQPDSVPLSDYDYCEQFPTTEVEPLSAFITPFQDELEGKTGVYVLEQGAEAMMSRTWLTSRAEQSIDIQYFIFSVDNVGLIATDYLVRAAERGVKIRVIIDDLLLGARADELQMLSAHHNISIKVYNPNTNMGRNLLQKVGSLMLDFHAFNQRMHNKVFIVDGQLAITGGRNIANEYFGFDHEYNFRDRDVFLAGEAVDDMQSSFETFWHSELSVPIEHLAEFDDQDAQLEFSRLHSYACNPTNFHPDIRKEIELVPDTFQRLAEQGKFTFVDRVDYISDQPGKNDQTAFLAGGSPTHTKLIELLSQSEKSIIIQTPYLVTSQADREFLQHLVDSGIEIKILTNSLASTDNLEAFSGYQRSREALLNTGVELYEFRPDARVRQRVMTEHMFKRLPTTPIFGLHAKSMVIDDSTTVIGTYNFDPRSANLNTESFTVIHSPEITKGVKDAMLIEMEPDNAWRITPDFNPDHKVSLWKRFKVKLRRIVPKSIL
ncbi:phospholipase D-like domain-containing protein [Vibrio sp. WXL210]|uniref:phospholipase D-like domain-containing protein n=1 Tax=Vibrio sp. WXL210 TaxID=3450709 RepID=UPI003EC8BB16